MSGAAQGGQPASRDVYSQLAARPDEMVARALADAEALLTGSAIQARCLECPAVAPVLPVAARQSWLSRILALLGMA